MPKPPPGRAGLPALALALAAASATASPPATAAPAALAPADDSLDLAVVTGYMPTFGKAVGAAGLADELSGPGPFTLFAPTEAAFARLPPGILDELLRPENQDRLRALLRGHQVAGSRPAASLAAGAALRTLDGGTLDLATGPGGLTVNGARVTSVDVGARNAVIHFIDRVLLPPG
jgi:uncharacterized surface protein with fasciclin (FAS1) repeats